MADDSCAADAGSSEGEDGQLPQGGTDEPLLFVLGLALCAAGGFGFWFTARAGRAAA